jgi:hypothetical protein
MTIKKNSLYELLRILTQNFRNTSFHYGTEIQSKLIIH